MLRIVGYQEHALRNVQPRQQRAKADATDSNSSAAAVLAADVSGYSCLMGIDEEGTLAPR